VSLSLAKAYKAKLCRMSDVPMEQFDYYFRRAFHKLNCYDPVKDVALISKVMKHLYRRDELKRLRS
jgi:hypothetical protein